MDIFNPKCGQRCLIVDCATKKKLAEKPGAEKPYEEKHIRSRKEFMNCKAAKNSPKKHIAERHSPD
jgi:hypothetical protein